jgi:3-deoxy-7-phosphoheptulonate synthase
VIIVMRAEVGPDSPEVQAVRQVATSYAGIEVDVLHIMGVTRQLTEVHVLGNTGPIPEEAFEALAGVERVIRVKERYRSIGRHEGRAQVVGFEYNGLQFTQDSFHVFAGLCAVDNRKNVEATFKALQANGITTTRAGAYKPRTSPYDFQGLGASCLPWVFELAGKYGIRVVAMEVLREAHVDEIRKALEQSGQATGVMLQIGTRNAQNFELLKFVGSQTEFPVLFKRGMGITLEESLNACEYIAANGNQRIVFALRGMKTHFGEPHRNMVDFAHVPVVRRMTRLPVCIDPSHSVGKKGQGPEGISDIAHVTAQAVVAGANMVLVDVHPVPTEAMCDGPQALTLEELPGFLEDVQLSRDLFIRRVELRERAKAKQLSEQLSAPREPTDLLSIARQSIDGLDRRMVVLLQQRAELMTVVAHAKRGLNHPIRDPVREAAVFEMRRQWANELGLDPKFVDAIFAAILEYSRALQVPAQPK